MSYHGDIRLGDTIDVKFTSRRFTTGAPFTLAGSPVISAYVGNGTTEITAGITLTVDFDARTGLNNVRVVATSGNGFATATNVQLVITTGTVDSVSVVGEVVGEFSIENRSALMPTAAARTLDVTATGEAGLDLDNTAGALGTSQFDAGFLTAALVATGAIDADALATDAVTEIRDAITGGAYALSTDANGRIRIVDGTAAGEINTNAGAIALVDLVTTVTNVTNNVNAKLADAVTHGGTTALLRLGSTTSTPAFYATNSGGDGVKFESTGLGGDGLKLQGHTGGHGVQSIGGVTGDGGHFKGGTTSGSGFVGEAAASGHGIQGLAAGASLACGIIGTGAGTGDGIRGVGGVDGIRGLAGSGVDIHGNLTGNITGNLSGSIGSVGTGGIAAAAFAAGAINAAATAADFVTEIRDAITGGAYALSTDANGRVRIVDGTAAGELDTASGAVTVGTNNDKTGYSLMQAFPTNFSALAITAGGAVTAGTVSDKTGYALATPAETAGRPTDLAGMIRRIFEQDHNKRTRDRSTGTVLLRNAADSATLETQTQSTSGTVDTITQGA